MNSFPIIALASEQTVIFGAGDDFYLFHHLNIVPCDEEGTLLKTEQARFYLSNSR